MPAAILITAATGFPLATVHAIQAGKATSAVTELASATVTVTSAAGVKTKVS